MNVALEETEEHVNGEVRPVQCFVVGLLLCCCLISLCELIWSTTARSSVLLLPPFFSSFFFYYFSSSSFGASLRPRAANRVFR